VVWPKQKRKKNYSQMPKWWMNDGWMKLCTNFKNKNYSQMPKAKNGG
jgi:pterin-4a-carbinolamine dehydratase